MGCGISKVDNLPLVVLCRERKELIRAAGDHRYALAAAHVAYFQALRGVGAALCRFVEEEVSDIPPPLVSSPVVTLPSGEGKSKTSSSSSNESHLHFASDSEEDPDPKPKPNPDPYAHSYESADPNQYPYAPSPPWLPTAANFYYMKSSTAVPTVTHEIPPPYPNPNPTLHPSSPLSPPMMGSYQMRPSAAIPTTLYENPDLDPNPYWNPYPYPYYGLQQSPAKASPPSPPPPEPSSWDFLNPFNSYESFYHNYGSRSGIGSGSGEGSPDVNQVREREGIPDLEDEAAEQKLVKVKKKGAEEGLGEGHSKVGTVKNDVELSVEKGSKSGSPGESGLKGMLDGDNLSKKGVSFEVERDSAESIELSSPSPPSKLTAISTHQKRDIREVVNEIKEQFDNVADCDKEVSGLLEPGKLQYRRRNPVFAIFSSRVKVAITHPTLTSSRSSSKWLRRRTTTTMKMAKATNGAAEGVIGMKSGSLSSTLEKLYAWEKKLFKEVKDEEKLRVIYEKKCKRLKILDDRGAELNKRVVLQASTKKLLTKIEVAIKAIDTISSKIHKLRDEELQPQLVELIQGLTKMWKNMVVCHQKQFQAILEAKNNNLIGRAEIRRDSSFHAAKDLEQELVKWYSCFSNWINTQKAYVEALNGWLLKCLLQEPEVTPDGVVPFSPSRIEAPLVFIICNDWDHAMERISESDVLRAMHTFASRIHELLELRDEEHHQKVKAEVLSKDFEKKLKALQQAGVVRGGGDAIDKKAILVANEDSIVLPDDERRSAVNSMKKRLDEERVKHGEALKQVHEAASGSLEMGFVPIIEAMDTFTKEMLKAHEEVRIQSPGGTS